MHAHAQETQKMSILLTVELRTHVPDQTLYACLNVKLLNTYLKLFGEKCNTTHSTLQTVELDKEQDWAAFALQVLIQLLGAQESRTDLSLSFSLSLSLSLSLSFLRDKKIIRVSVKATDIT